MAFVWMIFKGINWRTFGAAVVWIANLTAVLLYILTYNIIERYQSKLIFAYSCFFTLIYGSYQALKGWESERHKGFIIMTFSSLGIYFLFIILYYQFGIEDYKYMMGTFILTELITVSCVFISGLKAGLFKDDKGML